MCRLAAYLGQPVPLANIIIRPSHSLLIQSTEASEAKFAVNGDGFGIAWYGDESEPALYRDVLPAWADSNLLAVCRHVASPLFLAHVRASTDGETSRANCHPFVSEQWSFMHNGQIGSIGALRRELEASLSDTVYGERRGTTDSELFFLLLLNEGLKRDPATACDRAIRRLYATAKAQGVTVFIRLTCAFSDGKHLYCFRHASDGRCPSLYISQNFAGSGTVIASEPLDGLPANWMRVEPDRLMVCGDKIQDLPLSVRPECNALQA